MSDFDITDGINVHEYALLLDVMRTLYGDDLTRLEEHLEEFVKETHAHGGMYHVPEPFYSGILSSAGIQDPNELTSETLTMALAGLTSGVRASGACYFGPKPALSRGSASESGSGTGPYTGDSVRSAPAGYQGFGTRRRRRLLSIGQGQDQSKDGNVHKSATRSKLTEQAFQGNIAWSQYCGGTLIHPKWVLTAAGCVSDMDLTKVVNTHAAVLGGHECGVNGGVETRQECAAGTTRARLLRVVIHPLYDVDPRYDVALIELQEEVLGFEPAPLDDGTDLAFLPCKHPDLTAVGWWPNGSDTSTPIRRQQLEYVGFEACRQDHLNAYGYEDVGAHNLSICARATDDSHLINDMGEDAATCYKRGYFGQDGGALLAPREGTPDGFVLVGVIRSGLGAAGSALDDDFFGEHCPHDGAVARAHVRLAGMHQWILSVSALGASVPMKLGLHIESLHLPPHSSAVLRIYAGASIEADKQLEFIDYNCGANELSVYSSGGLVLSLSHLNTGAGLDAATPACGQRIGIEEEWGRDCRQERIVFSVGPLTCKQNAEMRSSNSKQQTSTVAACEDTAAGGIEGCMLDTYTGQCRAPNCTLASVSWEDLVNMEKIGMYVIFVHQFQGLFISA